MASHRLFVKMWNGKRIYFVPTTGKYHRCSLDGIGNEVMEEAQEKLEDLCRGSKNITTKGDPECFTEPKAKRK